VLAGRTLRGSANLVVRKLQSRPAMRAKEFQHGILPLGKRHHRISENGTVLPFAGSM
jgi:hypothetical protein